MPRRATGQAFFSRGSYYARVTVAPKVRRAFQLPHVSDETAAHARAAALASMAADLRRADVDRDLVVRLLEAGAGARDGAELDDALDTVRRVCAGELRPRPTNTWTFRQLGEMWTSGALADRWPDHVKRKKEKNSASIDRGRMEKHIYPIVGDVRLADFTLEHAERVMRALPSSFEPATRRHYAQLVRRVLALAVYPARVIETSPLPPGWLPKLGPPKAFGFLYPDEDRELLGCTEVPLCFRMLYGFAAREGMRKGEVERLAWDDLDLERDGLRLDTNKTDEPRAWALDASVARALRRWRELRGDPAGAELVFTDEGGQAFDLGHLAETFRGHLQAAGVTRPELFLRTKSRLPIRAHDLRATFVTVALANGRSEAWVADRTGHKSSTMINRYRRAARTIAELGLGELAPMDEAIPELRPRPDEKAAQKAAGSAGASNDGNETRREPEGSRRVAEERTRTSTPLRAQEPECDGAAASGTDTMENSGKTRGGTEARRPNATAAALSGGSAAFSATPQARTVRAMSETLADAFEAGDLRGAQETLEAIARLIGAAGGEGAEVVDLAARRRERDRG